MARARTAVVLLAVLGLLAAGVHAAPPSSGSTGTLDLTQQSSVSAQGPARLGPTCFDSSTAELRPGADTTNQRVRVMSKTGTVTGSITQDAVANDRLKQKILVVAPARANTEGLTLSSTGTADKVQRNIVCAGGGDGCRGTE
ncbi:hypothetical protein MNEG_4380 [Monoraphidium neglectum]|uniref:DUF5666 domain-containing protein n=1 Tax=Monoraphidium neglectum TaxID=145388 RepID=A0A0D2MKZ3_9CHLO|nr:hypothetical protein MNEG_4380 [Monoraphidium neglectum]KIZ03575.1 hypothetical protein MNEG_4380 [Monoraphidium neglectum]|eukprot:XP_013902594.1 hypothetical protein MNEG_4380 [Monoraphidium neglectum]